jgi:hypothetical protein
MMGEVTAATGRRPAAGHSQILHFNSQRNPTLCASSLAHLQERISAEDFKPRIFALGRIGWL